MSAVWYCSHYFLPVSLTLMANLLPVSTTPAIRVAKFASGVVNTAANLPQVSLIPVVHLHLRISPRILKKFEMTLLLFLGLGGRWFMEKHEAKKPHDTVPLKGHCYQSLRKGPTLDHSCVYHITVSFKCVISWTGLWYAVVLLQSRKWWMLQQNSKNS